MIVFNKNFSIKRRLIFCQFPLFFFIASFLVLIFFRWNLSLNKINQMTACNADCLVWDAPVYDLGVLGGLIALIGFSRLFYYPLRWIFCIFVSSVILFYVIDVFIYDLFSLRLQLADILKYSSDISGNKTVAWPRIKSFFGVSLFFTGAAACCFAILAIFSNFQKNNYRKIVGCLAAFPLLFVLRYLPQDKNYVLENQNKDFLSANIPGGVDKEFSKEFKNELLKLPASQEVCQKSDEIFKSVVLVVVESLSAYQSKKIAGLKNYLPHLDDISRKYAYLDEFYANGFTTDGGLIALLTGHVPLPQINRYQSTDVFSGYKESKQDFFKTLKVGGVHTSYFTSADLNFLKSRDWLENLGFDYIEGPDNSYYSALPRGVFADPGDKALYQRYLNWLDQDLTKGRMFSVIQTVTTHPPFVIPGSEKRGEEAAFQYADEALGGFVRALEDRGFFDAGVLVITGDHRSMTLLTAAEREVLGPSAPARVPAVIVGKFFEGKGRIAGQWQQTDVIPSVLAGFGMESCTSDYQGRFFGERVEAKFIFHTLGMERDKVLVKIKNHKKPFFVKLNGDATDWVLKPQEVKNADAVVQEINRQRADLPVVDSNIAHELLKIYNFIN